MPLPAEIRSVAALRHGVLRREDAIRLGATDWQIARWISAGELRRLGRGILTVRPVLSGAKPRHFELAHAIGAAYDGRVAISHHSAIVVAGLPTYDVDLATVRMVRCNGGDSRRGDGLQISRCSIALPTYSMFGAPVVTEAVAIVQVARERGIDAAVVAADEALHRGSITIERLESAVQLLEGVRPSPRARQLIGLVDAKSESPGESRLRLIAERAGIALESQFEVFSSKGGLLGRCDFRMVGTRVLVEFDGKLKYQKPEDAYKEKLRQDSIERRDWEFERFNWKHLSNEAEVIRRLRAAEDRADRRFGRAKPA